MQQYFEHILLLIRRILYLLAFMAITRLVFYINNFSAFSDIQFTQVLKIFVYGMRFDLSVLTWFNMLFLVMHLVPGQYKYHRIYQLVLKMQFLIAAAVIMLPNLADAEYFKYTRKRSTAYIFELFGGGSIDTDATKLLPTFMVQFWHLTLIGLVLLVLFWIFYPKFKAKPGHQPQLISNFIAQTLYMGIGMYLFIIMARGGLQYKPISNISAAAYGTPSQIPLILNTPFSILTTYGKKKIPARRYFSDEEAQQYFLPVVTLPVDTTQMRRMNVIVIILKSFSKEYIGYYNQGKGYTPFFDSLIAQSYAFRHAYSNGMQSIESMPSILSGIPAIMENPFITSDYVSNHIGSIAGELRKVGYYTAMFHGATNGSMGFESFSALAGFHEYYGRTQYSNEKHFDGSWGIYDEEFLQYTAIELEKKQQPFMACIMTLSSHHPFKLPTAYKRSFPEGELPIHKTIAYTDMALRKFMQKAATMSWYQNTLFVFTADHCGPSQKKADDASPAKFEIPIIFYSPTDVQMHAKTDANLAQQADIFPSILHYLNYKGTIVTFGKSLFDKSTDKYAINYLNGVYQLFYKNYLLQFDGEKTLAIFDLKKSKELKDNVMDKIKPEIRNAMENKIKSIIQQYNSRMINNQLVVY